MFGADPAVQENGVPVTPESLEPFTPGTVAARAVFIEHAAEGDLARSKDGSCYPPRIRYAKPMAGSPGSRDSRRVRTGRGDTTLEVRRGQAGPSALVIASIVAASPGLTPPRFTFSARRAVIQSSKARKTRLSGVFP